MGGKSGPATTRKAATQRTDRKQPLALVTGGHRRLGGQIALALARTGYRLALHGSHNVVIEASLEVALKAANADWAGFTADFGNPVLATSLMERVAAHFDRAPDLLVNNAAIFGQDRLEDVTVDALMHHYAVNCAAPVMLTRAFAQLPGTEGRSIVNILDQRLAHPHGDQLAYTLAKQALAGFTQVAARELAASDIRVNAVAPGLTIATDHYDEAQMDRLANMMPLGRLPGTDDVADAVLYLARARAVTGQVICVDGGSHMKGYPRDFVHL